MTHHGAPFYLLSGFHRSGTSLLAQTMEANGLHLGDNLMGASFANPNGHREDMPLVNIHDRMLNAAGYDWRCTQQTPLDTPDFLKQELADYVSERMQSAGDMPAGAKDPRALHFFSAWQSINTPPVKAVFVFRDWRYSVSSLLKRHSRDLLHSASPMATREVDFSFWRSPTLAASMWLASARVMLFWLENAPDNTLAFPIHALVDQLPGLFDRASQRGVEPNLLSLNHAYNPALLQSSVPASLLSMLPGSLIDACDDALRALELATGFTQSSEVVTLTNSSALATSLLKLAPPEHSSHIEHNLTSISVSNLTVHEALDVLNALDASKQHLFPWEELLTRTETDHQALEHIYKAALHFRRHDIAERAIQRCLLLAPRPWRWMYLGDLYLSRQHLALAEQCYLSAQKLSPDNATFFARLADVATARQEFGQAAELLTKAQAMDATKPAIASAKKRLDDGMATVSNNVIVGAITGDMKGAMPSVTDYMQVVEVMSHDSRMGNILDDYMVRYAFFRRDNAHWLQSALKSLPEPSARCLLDYLFQAMQRYWDKTVLTTELLPEQVKLDESLLSHELVKAHANIGIHIHVYYMHLVPELLSFLSMFPEPFRLVITCPEQHQNELKKRLPGETAIVPVENRGRDIAPWLIEATNYLNNCEIVLKLHTKATPHASALMGWRLQLLWCLAGSQEKIADVLKKFRNNPQLGILMPPYHPGIMKDIHWGKNRDIAQTLADTLSISLPEQADTFPAGSMFWYRPKALYRLTKRQWQPDDFPQESGQTDGTVMHAIERLFAHIAHTDNYSTEFIPVMPNNLT